jgi:REase_DpnII-MboI
MTSVEKVEKLIQKGQEVLNTHRPHPPNVIGFPTLDSGAFSAWQTQCLHFLESNLPSGSPYVTGFQDKIKKGYKGTVEAGIGILKSVKEDLEAGDLGGDEPAYNPMAFIATLCERFHLVARRLRSRHDHRATLDVQDEYDVQDLFHSLLHLHFSDVRAEEWTPSYAGKSSRVDFLLKVERIVVETKKTRQGLDAKEIGSQLIEDIARYQAHPDCDALLCFVYDPDGRIANPRGIENDLRRKEGDMLVEVLIRP